jgi:GTP cyclohydrolase I
MERLKPTPEALKTHFPSPLKTPPPMKDEERIALIAEKFQGIMELLGLDLSNESLSRTPERVAEMYVKEIFSGLNPETFPEISFIENIYGHEGTSNIVFMKVYLTSFCEHHFVPMIGHAYVAYLPKKKVIGLSKIPRIVRFFSRRPQVQERLNAQIADCLAHLLETEDVAVSISCQHFCIAARGIEDQSGWCTTQVLRGCFGKDEKRQQQFFQAMK